MKKWSEVLEIISGKNQKAVENPNGKYPIYGSGGPMGYADDYLCEAGATVIGRKGTINKPIFVNERFWNIDTAFGVQPGKSLVPKYLFYFCESFHFQELDKSTTIPSLAKRDLLKIEMPVPPLSEQERIVSRLDGLFSQLENAVDLLNKAKAQLGLYRQAVLRDAFSGKLTNAFPHGENELANYIEKPKYGTSKKCAYSPDTDGIPVYRIPNINYVTGRISHDDIKRASFTEVELSGIRLQADDILIIRSNGSVSLLGRAAMVHEVDEMGTFAGYLMRLRVKDPSILNPKFLFWFLQSHPARTYIEKKARSTNGINNINSREIMGINIPEFDCFEQKEIVRSIEASLSVCDSVEQTISAAMRQAENMRLSILKGAFEP